MTREKAFKTLKENLCGLCAFGSQNMELCDIRSCDNRDAIKTLEQEPRYIPYLMHKEMDIPISECQKAYDVAIEYLRSKAKVKG